MSKSLADRVLFLEHAIQERKHVISVMRAELGELLREQQRLADEWTKDNVLQVKFPVVGNITPLHDLLGIGAEELIEL